MLTPAQRSTFTIIKCQQNDIEMLNHNNYRVYRYVELNISSNKQQTPEKENNPQQSINQQKMNSIILQALPLGSGFVYQKQFMSMEDALKSRKQLMNTSNLIQASKSLYLKEDQVQFDYFEEQELQNTFSEMIRLAVKGQFRYGCFLPSNVLIDSQGNIRLKDPIIALPHPEKSDMKALGMLLLQSSTLNLDNKRSQEYTSIQKLVKKMERYSSNFIFKVWIMINEVRQCYRFLISEEKYQLPAKYTKVLTQITKLKSNLQNKRPTSAISSKIKMAQSIMKSIPKEKIKLQLKVTTNHSIKKSTQKNDIVLLSNKNKNEENSRSPNKNRKTHCDFRNRKMLVVPALGLLDHNKKKGNENRVAKRNSLISAVLAKH